MLDNNGSQSNHLRVLGTARLGNISKRNSYKLLCKLSSVDINLLDTAPSYPKSELRIGNFLAKDPNGINILTKFGRGKQVLNSGMMTQSLNLSLRRLKVTQVFGLSIHNREIAEIPEEIFVNAHNLKAEGKISKFGWCGEWSKLPIERLADFDYVMLPINPFLASFTELIKRIDVPIIAMNPFANFFWNYKKTNSLLNLYNERIRKIFNPEPIYLRSNHILTKPPKLDDLLKFVFDLKQVHGICFGSTKFTHIAHVTRCLDELNF
jgi:aryl-alcohol dehydrogenase-like predicted oxidoreductase